MLSFLQRFCMCTYILYGNIGKSIHKYYNNYHTFIKIMCIEEKSIALLIELFKVSRLVYP